MKKLTNKEIADKLGISAAAVSYALNNQPGVSDETRKKILELAQGSNTDFIYQTDSNRMLSLVIFKRHGEIIIDKPFFSSLMESIQLEAQRHSYMLEVLNYNLSMDINTFIDSINNRNVSGIILLATEMLPEDLAHFNQLHVPLILLDSQFDLEPYDSISLDNQNAVLRAFDYAVSMGHKDIGYLKSSVFINNFEHRYDGFLKGLRKNGLEKANHPILSLHSNIEMSYVQMNQILDHLPDDFHMPTCFLADLDYIAIGAMRAFQQHGYKIPDDVSLIGFDDVTASEICVPRLTTLRVNQSDIGCLAVKGLLERIDNPHDYHVQCQISSELITRDSVKKLI